MTRNEIILSNISSMLEGIPAPSWLPILDDEKKKLVDILIKQKRVPFLNQACQVILQQYQVLKNNNASIMISEMGTGKTTKSNSIANLLFHTEFFEKGMKTVFLTSGSKHIKKMKREVEETLGKDYVEVYIVRSQPRKTYEEEINHIQAMTMPRKPGKMIYIIFSKDTGKNDLKKVAFKENNLCPKCSEPLGKKTKKEWRLNKKVGGKFVWRCKCGEKTYNTIHTKTGDPSKTKRAFGYDMKKLQGKRKNKIFDYLIVDEVHEFQNPDSLQTIFYKQLVSMSRKTTVMTGTLSNGYASSVFYILYPLIPMHFKAYGFDYEKIGIFVDYFGSKEESTVVKVDSTGKEKTTRSVRELPKINDRIVGFLAPFSTWFAMSDLGRPMPEFTEKVHKVHKDDRVEAAFDYWFERAEEAIALENMEKVDLKTFKAARHYRINNPMKPYVHVFKGEVFEPYIPSNDEEIDMEDMPSNIEWIEAGGELLPYTLTNKEIEVEFNPLPQDYITSKEEKLIEIVKDELSEGRRCLVYGTYNDSTNLYDRLEYLLSKEGIHVGILPGNVKAEDLEEWITDFEGDVLLLPQKRVATGLDLVMFQTVIFYEIDKQLRIVQQAKVRPWRPVGQDHEVRCHYIAYEGNQADSLASMGQKMRAAATVEGVIINESSIANIYDYNPELTEMIANISFEIEESEEIESDLLKTQDLNEVEAYYQESLDSILTEIESLEELPSTGEESEVNLLVEESVEEESVEEESVEEESVEEDDSEELEIVVQKGGQLSFIF